ncbi:MAG: hypothetical protein ACK5KU_11035 [Beutenbergiaceae bacterium]
MMFSDETNDEGGLILAHRSDTPGIKRALAAGRIQRLRRGAYTYLAGHQPDDQRRRALLQTIAVARQSRTPVVVSHESAALIWGLYTVYVPTLTHVIQSSRPSRNDAADVKRHCAALPPEDATSLDEVQVTSLTRTVLDCARTLPFREAVVICDAAHGQDLDLGALASRVRGIAGRPGAQRARMVLQHTRPGSESAGETLSRLEISAAGLPDPQLQVAVTTPCGRYRLDLGWPQWRVGIEFDGWMKYDRADSASVLFAEKQRENAIVAQGWTIVRLTFRDLREPQRLRRIVHDALRRAGWPGSTS